MANFETAYAQTSKFEGYYVNDPIDQGGETYAGISRKYHPNWGGWQIVDRKARKYNEHIQELDVMVQNFFKRYYWDAIKAGDICNEKVAAMLYDFYIHSGSVATKTIQRVVGVTADGIIGPQSIQAINNYDNGLFSKLKLERIAFLKGIVARKETQRKYLDGWLTRVNSIG